MTRIQKATSPNKLEKFS